LQAEVKFDKAQGSSHNDVADMRDVARKAAEKSRQSATDIFETVPPPFLGGLFLAYPSGLRSGKFRYI
jgi:hypothetical protein